MSLAVLMQYQGVTDGRTDTTPDRSICPAVKQAVYIVYMQVAIVVSKVCVCVCMCLDNDSDNMTFDVPVYIWHGDSP